MLLDGRGVFARPCNPAIQDVDRHQQVGVDGFSPHRAAGVELKCRRRFFTPGSYSQSANLGVLSSAQNGKTSSIHDIGLILRIHGTTTRKVQYQRSSPAEQEKSFMHTPSPIVHLNCSMRLGIKHVLLCGTPQSGR